MTDTAQACGNCKFYDKEQDAIGMCLHPITNLMRELVRHHMVPYAFNDIEVTTLMPYAGKDCPTWTAKL